MWIQIDLCPGESHRDFFNAVRWESACQLIGEIFGLTVG